MPARAPAVADTLTPADICRDYNVSRFAVHRWLKTGVRGIRLIGRMVGGRWQIARADVESFIDQLTAAALPPDPTPAAKRTRAADIAERAAAGLDRLRRRGLNV